MAHTDTAESRGDLARSGASESFMVAPTLKVLAAVSEGRWHASDGRFHT